MMQTQMLLNLSGIESVKNFVNKAYKFNDPIDVKQGRYTVDGKSLMGLFSLDLFLPVMVTIQTHDSGVMADFYHEMEEFEVESSQS